MAAGTAMSNRARVGIIVTVAVVAAAVGAGGGYVARRAPQPETVMVNFDAESSPHEGLGPGWSTFEQMPEGDTFTWCAATRCTLDVESRASGDRMIRLRVFPFRFPDAPEQTLTLSINGAALGTRSVPDGTTILTFLAERSRWRKGPNVLQFDFAYAAAPSAYDAANEDPRKLSVAFDWLEILPK